MIRVDELEKTFEIYKKEEGFLNSIKSFFNREKVSIEAVKNISFKIEKGEKVGLLGMNGAGKSTTIKMLTGILYPTSGEISVLGYTPTSDRKEYVKNIGVIFGQKSQLWIDIPPIDAFSLHKKMYDIPEEEYEKRLQYLSKKLGIEDAMKRPVRNLSLGERMKCEFVLSLLHNPDVLFLDEPTIGVDAISKDEIRNFLDEINKEFETTLILTTHDMDDIEEVCDRLIVLDEGEIIHDGDMKGFKDRYVNHIQVSIDYSRVKNQERWDEILSQGEVTVDGKRYKELKIEKDRDISQYLSNVMDAVEVTDLDLQEPDLKHIIRSVYDT